MTSSSLNLVRVAALALMTALFAGVWNNDQPEYYLALSTAPSEVHFARRPNAAPAPAMVRAEAKVNLGLVSKTITVEADALVLPQSALAQHLAQLPLGLPAGDYRIVDAQGGVGWLRVRSESDGVTRAAGSELITTSVGTETVRFLRTQLATVEIPAATTTR